MEPNLNELREWWEHKPPALVGLKPRFCLTSEHPYPAKAKQICARGPHGAFCLHNDTNIMGRMVVSTSYGRMDYDCALRTIEEMTNYHGPLATDDERRAIIAEQGAAGSAIPGEIEEPTIKPIESPAEFIPSDEVTEIPTSKFDDMYPLGTSQRKMISDAEALGKWVMVRHDRNAPRGRQWHVATFIE